MTTFFRLLRDFAIILATLLLIAFVFDAKKVLYEDGSGELHFCIPFHLCARG